MFNDKEQRPFTLRQGLLLLALALLLIFLAGCSAGTTPVPQPEATPPAAEPAPPAADDTPAAPDDSAAAAVDINIIALKGPTGIGVAYLMEEAAQGRNSYHFELAGAPDAVVAKVTSGSVDIAALPSNLAATLYAKTAGQIHIAAISTYGSLYLLENGDTIHSWDDLRGKTIYATGQGANPEYILRYLLGQNGLTVGEDVEIEFKSEHAELATLMAGGDIVLGMLPEPNVTAAMMQNGDLRIAFDLSAEWDKVAQGNLAMSCLVVNREFAAAHPEALQQFLADLQTSIDFALNQVDEAAALCEAHAIIPKAAIAKQAIPNCNLTFISGADMQPTITPYLEVLLQANPQSVGGALPGADFYYLP